MQPMQSGNGLGRHRIVVKFAEANLNGLCVNQSDPQLFFDELQDIFHPYFDAARLITETIVTLGFRTL